MTSIVVRTVIIYITLSISLRIMGKRQIGELDVGELVSTLLISEIASIPIDDPDIPLMNAVMPILFILSLEILISTVKNKSEKMKGLIEGKPQYIIYKGRVLQKVWHRACERIRVLCGCFEDEGKTEGHDTDLHVFH